MINCQGKCKEHSGTIKRVRVQDYRTNMDWGYFLYCDTAIGEDTRNGLVVSIINQEQKVRSIKEQHE